MKITREMVRGTAMGIRAIDNVIRYAENDALIATASAQKEALIRFHDEAAGELSEKQAAEAEGSKLAKAMVKASSAFSAMTWALSSSLPRFSAMM